MKKYDPNENFTIFVFLLLCCCCCCFCLVTLIKLTRLYSHVRIRCLSEHQMSHLWPPKNKTYHQHYYCDTASGTSIKLTKIRTEATLRHKITIGLFLSTLFSHTCWGAAAEKASSISNYGFVCDNYKLRDDKRLAMAFWY